jgi:hypothetical protein
MESFPINLESPVQYKVHKYILDPKSLQICVDRIDEVGYLRKKFLYYHNFGTYLTIVIVEFRLYGEPKITRYVWHFQKKKRKVKSE